MWYLKILDSGRVKLIVAFCLAWIGIGNHQCWIHHVHVDGWSGWDEPSGFPISWPQIEDPRCGYWQSCTSPMWQLFHCQRHEASLSHCPLHPVSCGDMPLGTSHQWWNLVGLSPSCQQRIGVLGEPKEESSDHCLPPLCPCRRLQRWASHIDWDQNALSS